MDGYKYVTVEKSTKTGPRKKSDSDAHNSQVHSILRRSQLHLFSARVSWGFTKQKKKQKSLSKQNSDHRF